MNICKALGSALYSDEKHIKGHVLYVDIDVHDGRFDDKQAVEEAYLLMKLVGASHICIYRTKHGYNLVSFDLFSEKEIRLAYQVCKKECEFHKRQIDDYGEWFLRVSDGKVLLSVLVNDKIKAGKKVSLAHMIEFKRAGMLTGDYMDKIIDMTKCKLEGGMVRIDFYKRRKEVE